jgi:inner membrane protein
MATPITHALVGVGMGQLYTSRSMPWLFWLAAAGLSMLPDLDALAFRFGIPYESAFGHRGLSHSLLMALLSGGVTGLLLRDVCADSWWGLCGLFTAVVASHGILDACTDGGLGVAFFAPFDSARYFFPWRPIRVSPLGAHFFSPAGLEALVSEVFWIWIPFGAVVLAVKLFR